MRRFRLLASITLFLVTMQLSHVAADDGITPQDLGAGFRLNRSLFKSPRVIFKRNQQWKFGWRAHAVKTAAQSEKLAESPDIDESKRASLRRGAQLLRDGAASAEPLNVFEDYWTDWKGFHGRVPALPPADVPETWTFPDAPISPDNLVSTYKDHVVFSFRPDSAPRTRVWNGINKDGQRSGRVSDKPVHEVVSTFQFPPLTVQDPEWGPLSLWHPIDEFFEKYEDGAIVLAEEELNGRPTYHVRHVTLVPAPAGFSKAEGKFEFATIVEAWIDADRGFLPLKLEWHSAIHRDGVPLVTSGTPHKIVEVTEVRAVDQAGFYPVKGISRDYVDEPRRDDAAPSIDDFLAGKAPPAPRKLLNTESQWEALRIEPDVPISDAMYALEFPASTNYFDETRQRVMIQGLTVEEVDRLLAPDPNAALEAHQPSAGLLSAGSRSKAFWLGAANVIVVIVLLGWLRYARKR